MKKALILVGSPRRDGNSATLAEAVARGVEAGGARADIRVLDDHIAHFLRDCRTCRRDDGECALDDTYRQLFFDDFLPADAVVLCSPIFWYGLSAQTKAFFDRSFCYYAASHPASAQVHDQMGGKRLALVLASEETYPGAALGIMHQVQEFARYTGSQFVGSVRGFGNARGEVAEDPGKPLAAAERLGAELFAKPYSDYRMKTPRSPRVWAQA